MDSPAQKALGASEIINQQLSPVTQRFGRPKSPRASEIIKELLSRVTMYSTAKEP
jgi:hypothetical protein